MATQRFRAGTGNLLDRQGEALNRNPFGVLHV